MKLIYLSFILSLSGCATYKYADNVRLVAFDNNISKGTSVGNIRGEDCVWKVLGIPFKTGPTVDQAFISAREQKAGVNLRYANKVTTSNEGFDAGVVAKNCIVVRGIGYK